MKKMIKVEVLDSLISEIIKEFNKTQANKIIDLMYRLEKSPNKGKLLSSVGGILIKELKYKNFRFYFIVDGYKLKIYSEKELIDILLKFVRMSDKKYQQKTIEEIREVLIKIGPKGF